MNLLRKLDLLDSLGLSESSVPMGSPIELGARSEFAFLTEGAPRKSPGDGDVGLKVSCG